jgi:hypothetical protein
VNEDEKGPAKDTPAPEPPSGGESPPAEMSREDRIAAARAKAEALKAQRAAAGTAPSPAPPRPAPPAGVKGWATSENPGGAPPAPPQNPKVEAFGTITQSIELRCESTEDQNIRKILGGLGAYRNPLRGVWQLDYRYYTEALARLRAAGYQVDGRDYLGRPLDQWTPEKRGWTRLS